MADRGFDISDVLGDRGVKVTIPNFKGQGRSQLKEGEGKSFSRTNYLEGPIFNNYSMSPRWI